MSRTQLLDAIDRAVQFVGGLIPKEFPMGLHRFATFGDLDRFVEIDAEIMAIAKRLGFVSVTVRISELGAEFFEGHLLVLRDESLRAGGVDVVLETVRPIPLYALCEEFH